MSFLGSCLILLIVAFVLLICFPFLDIGYEKLKQHFDQDEEERKEEESNEQKKD